jgi:acylaminoacyl-peptidase
LLAVRAAAGAAGFGEDGVQSLPGLIGQQDVQDCLDCLDAAVAAGAGRARCCCAVAWDCVQSCRERCPNQLARSLAHTTPGFADGSRAAVVGGSHGGFLTGHLVAQHPQRFR